MSDFYSLLIAAENRPHAERERVQLQALSPQIKHAKQKSAAFAEILASVEAAAVTSRAALASLPVTRKTELLVKKPHAQQRLKLAKLIFSVVSVALVSVPRCCGYLLAQERFMNQRANSLTIGARPELWLQLVLKRVTWCTTVLVITLHRQAQ
jgi:hypothetical protein